MLIINKIKCNYQHLKLKIEKTSHTHTLKCEWDIKNNIVLPNTYKNQPKICKHKTKYLNKT